MAKRTFPLSKYINDAFLFSFSSNCTDSVSSDFSARPQALGYLYQAELALLLLIDSRPDTSAVIEGLDDIEVIDDDSLELNQLKHHINESGSLSDKSVDLWKTLRVWSEQISSDKLNLEETSLNLITTAAAPQDSAAKLLGPDLKTRDSSLAHSKLATAAKESENQNLNRAFKAFLDLEEPLRKRLVNAITILDSSIRIDEVEDRVKDKIKWSVAPTLLDSLYERLRGWWYSIIVKHLLEENASAIHHSEVHAKVVSIAESLRSSDDLPIDFARAKPENLDPENDERMFVRQLRAVDISTKRIEYAMLDFYRAFAQRSRWTRENLVLDDEITQYEEALVEEWGRYKAILEDEMLDSEADESDLTRIGRKLVAWVESEVEKPIRRNVTQGFVVRGSYHMLANETVPRVHWHPEFLDRVKAALTVAQ